VEIVRLNAVAQARGQVLLIVVVVPLLVLAMVLTATAVYQEEIRGGRLIKDAERSQALLRLEIAEASSTLHAQLDGLSDNQELAAAMAAGNAVALERRVAPIFAHMRDQHNISHLYFTRPDRSPLLRLDGTGKSGQVVDRLILYDTAESAGSSDGLDLNAFGVVTLRVTVVWRDADGKLIGFVEIGRDIAPLIDEVHRVMGLDILLLVKKDLLDRDRWEEGERQSGAQGSWDELANAVSVARTLPTIPTAIGLMLEDGQPSMTGGITIVEVGKRSLAMSVHPLLDLEKKPIGDVVLLRDVTDTSRTMTRSLALLVAFAAALIVAGALRCRWLLAMEKPADAPPAG
jgi:hypothetical protein